MSIERMLKELEQICDERLHFNETIYLALIQEKDPKNLVALYNELVLKGRLFEGRQFGIDTESEEAQKNFIPMIKRYFLSTIKFYKRVLESIKSIYDKAEEKIRAEIPNLVPNIKLVSEYAANFTMPETIEAINDLHFDIYYEMLASKNATEAMWKRAKEKRKKNKCSSQKFLSEEMIYYGPQGEGFYLREMRGLLNNALLPREKSFINHLKLTCNGKNIAWKFEIDDFIAKNNVLELERLMPKDVEEVFFKPDKTINLSKISPETDEQIIVRDTLIKLNKMKDSFHEWPKEERATTFRNSESLLLRHFRKCFYEFYSFHLETKQLINDHLKKGKMQVKTQTADKASEIFEKKEAGDDIDECSINPQESLWHQTCENKLEKDKMQTGLLPILPEHEHASPPILRQYTFIPGKKKHPHQDILDKLNEKPLQAITYHRLMTLVESFGGKIIRTDGSHKTIQLNGIRGGVFEPHKEPSILCTRLFHSLLQRANLLSQHKKVSDTKLYVRTFRRT